MVEVAIVGALQRCKSSSGPVQGLLCDSGYVGQPFAQSVQEVLGGHVAVQIAKRSQLLQCHARALDRRAQLRLAGQEQGVWKNCERWPYTNLAFLALLRQRR